MSTPVVRIALRFWDPPLGGLVIRPADV